MPGFIAPLLAAGLAASTQGFNPADTEDAVYRIAIPTIQVVPVAVVGGEAAPNHSAPVMKANLQKNTGKSVDQWADLVRKSGIAKHGDQMKLLKETHGLGHGYANLICHTAKGSLDVPEDDLLAGQYAGKESLRPVYDVLEAYAKTLGKDVNISPKKTGVAFRRTKNIAVVTPGSKTRIDLGLNIKGTAPTPRLLEEKPGAMCTHKVRLESPADLDPELKAWFKAAYDKA